jgi:DNA-binding NarL/FixJ family response regulator
LIAELPTYLRPAILAHLSDAGTPSPRPADVTGREVEVLRLIAKGATNREIAEQLVISEGTVKNHISNILSRLGLRDRTQAAIYARENGWL